jgi:hypothetical protein
MKALIRRRGYTKGENLISPLHRAKIKVAKLLSQFQGEAADSSELDFKLKVDGARGIRG